MTEPTNLYRCFDSDGRLLYIGVSLSAIARLKEHQCQSEWFVNIARVEIETLPDRASALCAEKDAIAGESPQFNIMHNIMHAKCSLVAVPKDSSEGKTIAEKIHLSGLSLQDLATAAEVPYQTARRWARGESEPKLHQVAGLAHALGCKPSELIPSKA